MHIQPRFHVPSSCSHLSQPPTTSPSTTVCRRWSVRSPTLARTVIPVSGIAYNPTPDTPYPIPIFHLSPPLSDPPLSDPPLFLPSPPSFPPSISDPCEGGVGIAIRHPRLHSHFHPTPTLLKTSYMLKIDGINNRYATGLLVLSALDSYGIRKERKGGRREGWRERGREGGGRKEGRERRREGETKKTRSPIRHLYRSRTDQDPTREDPIESNKPMKRLTTHQHQDLHWIREKEKKKRG